MTEEDKEKLIALSDLNREDNIKYISSEAQGIAITLDGDRYSPTLCKLERAYICGRRKSEEQIEKAKELLRFWVNDFYDSFNHSNKYEARHKALVETEQFLKEE